MRQRKMFIFMCKLYVCITVNSKDWFDLALFDLNGYHCTAVLQKVLFKWGSLYTSKDWLLFKVSLGFWGTGFLELLFLNKPHRSWLGSRLQAVQIYIYIYCFCFVSDGETEKIVTVNDYYNAAHEGEEMIVAWFVSLLFCSACSYFP